MNGLSEIQQKLLTLILAGKSDSEIGKELGIAQSTVRNHRFKLREKEKHAKLFLAIMNQIKESTNKQIEESDTGTLQEIHSSATMVDDRYNITDVERKKTLATYLDAEGRLKQIPARAKKKIIILNEVIGRFEMKKEYTEREVNAILKDFYEEDYPSIRRALIEYGYMERTRDCKSYHRL